jgi:uncharacterized membrane protein
MTTIPLPTNAASGTALAINNAGQVVVSYFAVDGTASISSNLGEERLLLWDDGIETLLPQFSAPRFETVFGGMNSAGILVGRSGGRAAVWQDGQIYDLNNLIPSDSGWALTSATAINDLGEIVGYGTYQGIGVPFVLMPTAGSPSSIPEPATLSILAFAGLPVLLRRKTSER